MNRGPESWYAALLAAGLALALAAALVFGPDGLLS